MNRGVVKLEDLDQFVGKYVGISSNDGVYGGSGWVVVVGPVKDYPHLGVGREVCFDYGMSCFVKFPEYSVEEIEPPPGDGGLFNPDNKPLPFTDWVMND